MFLTDISVTTGGRPSARRSLVVTAALVLGIGSLAGAGQTTDPAPAVREERGVYLRLRRRSRCRSRRRSRSRC